VRSKDIQLSHEWVIVKPDRLKTFKHVEYQPILPKRESMSVVKNEDEAKEPEEVEVEEVERTIAFILQKGVVVAIGPGESQYAVGDRVLIRNNTGIDFQWLGNPAKGTCPKLLKKHEIIAKLV
jgi:hypothetical protein